MNLRQGVFKNIISLLFSNVLVRIITAAFSIAIVRYLGKTDYGVYSSILAFVSIIMAFSDLGMGQLIIREGSRNKSNVNSLLPQAILIRSIFGLVAINLAFVIAIYALQYNYISRILTIILAFSVFLRYFHTLVFSSFQAIEKMEYIAYYNVIYSLMLSAGMLLVITLKFGLVELSIFNVMSGLITLILILIKINKKFEIKFNLKKIFSNLKSAIPFGLGYIFYWVYLQSGIFILSLFTTKEIVGSFAASFRIVTVLYVLPGIIAQALYPRLYRHGKSDKSRHKELFIQIMKVLGIFGVTISAILFIFKSEIILTLYGENFKSAVNIFSILTGYFLFQCLNVPLADALTTSDRQKQRVKIQGSTLILSIVVQIWAAYNYGAIGIAYSLLVTEIFMFILYQIFIRKLDGFWGFNELLKALLIPSSISILVYLLLNYLNFSNVILVLLTVFTFIVLTFLKNRVFVLLIFKQVKGNAHNNNNY